MQDFGEAFALAFRLVISADPDLLEIILLSLKVSLTAVVIACLIGLPLGAAVAMGRFPGRTGVIILLNALMGLPPVVVGLLVYLLLSNAGPLGWLQPAVHADGDDHRPDHPDHADRRRAVAAGHRGAAQRVRRAVPLTAASRAPLPLATLLWDARYSLLTVALAGFGRAVAEVGAVIIVGGNIDHLTRVMTTAIALETSKGDLALALALGIVLIRIALR